MIGLIGFFVGFVAVVVILLAFIREDPTPPDNRSSQGGQWGQGEGF